MDIKELIMVVIEVVEKVKKEENQHIVGIFFHKDNESKLKDYSSNVYNYKNYHKTWLPDVLYLDFISVKILPKVALGIDDNSIASLIKEMLMKNKKIIVLDYDPSIISDNKAYYSLFENYYKIVESYGITFEKQKAINKINLKEKVLTKNHIIANKNYKEIVVNKNTVITTLALDEAQKENIIIRRI